MKPLYIYRENPKSAACLAVSCPEPWKLYAGPSVESINYQQVVLQGTGAGVFTLPAKAHARQYFYFESAHFKTIMAEEKLPMQGGYNFRDMGGMRAIGGGKVVWGQLFRTDDLVGLTGTDLDYLASIPTVSVIDFRTPEEVVLAPDKLPVTTQHYYNYHIIPGKLSGMGGVQSAARLMREIYRQLVSDDKIMATYRKFFERIQEPDKLPLIFHCSAGKDRTGLAAALFYFALNVHYDDIMENYMLSAVYIEGKYPPDNDRFTVKPCYLEAAVDEVKKNYGSMEKYLVKALGLNLSQFKEKFLS